MGADIHAFTEIRRGGAWRATGEVSVNHYAFDYKGDRYLDLAGVRLGRNYSLFAVLAGVRNDLGRKTTPIAEPKGAPEDISPECARELEGQGLDAHSVSWFTLAEIYDHDWTTPVHHECWVRRRKNAPSVGVHDAALADPDALAARAVGLAEMFPDQTYSVWGNWHIESCQWSSEGQGASGWRTAKWVTQQQHAAGPDWWRLVADMGAMAHRAGVSPGDVRLFFFFDN